MEFFNKIKEVFLSFEEQFVFRKCLFIYNIIINNKRPYFKTTNYMLPHDLPMFLYNCEEPNSKGFFVSTVEFASDFNKQRVNKIPVFKLDLIDYAEFTFLDRFGTRYFSWNKYNFSNFTKSDRINTMCKDQLFKNIWFYHWVYKKNNGKLWSPTWYVKYKEV